AASAQDVESAVEAARAALVPWNAMGFEKRTEIAQRFAQRLAEYKLELAEIISRETGKPLWESQSEAESMRGKVPASIEAYEERCKVASQKIGDARGWIRYKPHGVVAVLG